MVAFFVINILFVVICCSTGNDVKYTNIAANYTLFDKSGQRKCLEITTKHDSWTLDVIPNQFFKTQRYVEYEHKIYKGNRKRLCEFHGKVRGKPNSWAALSLCNGVTGIFFDGWKSIELLFLETGKLIARSASSSGHTYSDGDRLGMESNEFRQQGRYTRETRSLEQILQTKNHNYTRHPNWKRYIELWIVVDKTLYKYFKSNETKIHEHCQKVVNIASSMFSSLDVHLLLTGVEIWKKDKSNVTSNHIESLSNFTEHRKHLFKKGHSHDYTILLTGIDFKGDTIGYAYINAMCHFARSAAIVQYENDTSPVIVAGTFAHEIGHGLGALHDTPTCKTGLNDDYGIMIKKSTTRVHWTNCTRIYIARYIDRFHCLRDRPAVPITLAVCGNGIVEGSEQCDCGIGGPCRKCCSTETCTLKQGAKCGSGDCCNLKECSLHAAGIMCRENANECDLPEYCSGKSSTCPKNVFKHNGHRCDKGQGRCHNGTCGSSDLLCEDFIGPGVHFPEHNLLRKLRRNFGGKMYCKEVFCQTPLNIGWTKDAHTLLRDRDFFRFHSSPLILFKANESLYYNRPRLDGVPCGDNKMCMNASCVAVPEFKSDYCKSNCSNNGICNSNGNCHCFKQFEPPSCRHYGYGGSIDSGSIRNRDDDVHHQTLIFLVLLFAIILILVACFCWSFVIKIWDLYVPKAIKDVCTNCTACYNICFFPCIWLGVLEGRKSTERAPYPASSRPYEVELPMSSRENYSRPLPPPPPPVNRNLKPSETQVAHVPIKEKAVNTNPVTNRDFEEERRKNINKSYLHGTVIPKEKLTLSPTYLNMPQSSSKNPPAVKPKPKKFPPDRPPKPKSKLQKNTTGIDFQQPQKRTKDSVTHYHV